MRLFKALAVSLTAVLPLVTHVTGLSFRPHKDRDVDFHELLNNHSKSIFSLDRDPSTFLNALETAATDIVRVYDLACYNLQVTQTHFDFFPHTYSSERRITKHWSLTVQAEELTGSVDFWVRWAAEREAYDKAHVRKVAEGLRKVSEKRKEYEQEWQVTKDLLDQGIPHDEKDEEKPVWQVLGDCAPRNEAQDQGSNTLDETSEDFDDLEIKRDDQIDDYKPAGHFCAFNTVNGREPKRHDQDLGNMWKLPLRYQHSKQSTETQAAADQNLNDLEQEPGKHLEMKQRWRTAAISQMRKDGYDLEDPDFEAEVDLFLDSMIDKIYPEDAQSEDKISEDSAPTKTTVVASSATTTRVKLPEPKETYGCGFAYMEAQRAKAEQGLEHHAIEQDSEGKWGFVLKPAKKQDHKIAEPEIQQSVSFKDNKPLDNSWTGEERAEIREKLENTMGIRFTGNIADLFNDAAEPSVVMSCLLEHDGTKALAEKAHEDKCTRADQDSTEEHNEPDGHADESLLKNADDLIIQSFKPAEQKPFICQYPLRNCLYERIEEFNHDDPKTAEQAYRDWLDEQEAIDKMNPNPKVLAREFVELKYEIEVTMEMIHEDVDQLVYEFGMTVERLEEIGLGVEYQADVVERAHKKVNRALERFEKAIKEGGLRGGN